MAGLRKVQGARAPLFDRFLPDAAEIGTDWREATRPGPQWLKSLFVRG